MSTTLQITPVAIPKIILGKTMLNKDYFNGREVGYVESGVLKQGFNTLDGQYDAKKAIYNTTGSMSITETRSLNEDTTWAELGMTETSYYLNLRCLDSLEKTLVTVYKTETISQTAEKLAEYGISLTITDGKATFDYNNDETDSYRITFEHVDGYHEIMSMLGIDNTYGASSGNPGHDTIRDVTTYAESTSSNAIFT